MEVTNTLKKRSSHNHLRILKKSSKYSKIKRKRSELWSLCRIWKRFKRSKLMVGLLMPRKWLKRPKRPLPKH